ncbi:MAG TPA: beta-ketoacyl-[acyl-carrier-protein] synthase family protein [Myxococcaceae bacterium]|nr:beta-ketoacyl-[acyl-carrier-protein] synthase family protein [Myxococcaceae bacterium]
MDSPRVVVTGLGMVTPFGVGTGPFWKGILAGASAASPVTRFDPAPFATRFACQVDDSGLDLGRYVKNRKSLKLMGRATGFVVSAAALAMEGSGLRTAPPPAERFGVSLGMGGVGNHDIENLDALGQLAQQIREAKAKRAAHDLASQVFNPLFPLQLLPNITAAHVAIEHGLRGENLTVCTACTSSSQAVGEALRMLRSGRADAMLAGGGDAMVNPTGLTGFGMLGVLSRRNESPSQAARPFDRGRDGFVIGEGGVVLALETVAHATRRGAPILAELCGYASAADAYRVTDEPEDAHGSVQAMQQALADAHAAPADVQYVNAHGTGTRMNDRTEARALHAVFGPHTRRLLVSSTKSQVGHLVAGAGAIELAACVLALQHQVAPPSINIDEQDPECDLTLVANQAREARLDVVLKSSFGFGGQNACLVLRRWRGE